jgi:hypothetical protein
VGASGEKAWLARGDIQGRVGKTWGNVFPTRQTYGFDTGRGVLFTPTCSTNDAGRVGRAYSARLSRNRDHSDFVKAGGNRVVSNRQAVEKNRFPEFSYFRLMAL